MADKFGSDVSSGNSGGASGKLERGVGRVDDLKSETLIGNPGDKGGLSDGVRVSGEAEVLGGKSNSGIVISEAELKPVESGNLESYHSSDANRNRVVETASRSNSTWESWGVMRMVGRVLDGKLDMDNEVEDVDTSENRGEGNLVAEMDWQGVTGEPASEYRFGVIKTDNENDSVKLYSRNLGEGAGLNTRQGVICELTSGNKIEIGRTDIDNDCLKLDSSCPGEGTGLNVIGETTLENKIEIEITDVDNVSVKQDSSCPGEGNDSNGNQELFSHATGPVGQLKSEEEFDDEDDWFIPKTRGEHDINEKEGEYYVSDLVWGKVKCHPWWPGQIFAPIAASDKAARHYKRRSYLIAYFGDNTFAWNEESTIKHFRMHFSEMVKQSNSDKFSHALQCALDETARRVEFGLSCPCLPQDVYNGIKTQVIENAGIWDDQNLRDGGDNLSGAASFNTVDVMLFLESLAVCPQSKPERLQFTIAKAQLLAYSRWKGHYQLPVFKECGWLLEDGTVLNAMGTTEGLLPVPVSEVDSGVSSKKRKSTARDGSSCKHKHPSGDQECPPKKKEKIMTILISSDSSNSQNNDEKLVKSARKVVSSGENCVMVDTTAKNTRGRRGRKRSGESQTVEVIPSEIPTPDAVLSKLMLAAKKPMQWHGAMISVVGLLREFRNSIYLEKSGPENVNTDCGMHEGEQPSSFYIADTSGPHVTGDSYWTDRIIQSYSQDQVLFEPKKQNERAAQPEVNVAIASNLDDNKGKNVVVDLDAENPPAVMHEEASLEDLPTCLILQFSNLESIPSIKNLNEIFSRYGPLYESDTKILPKSKRAKVIFKRKADAETAFSSTGKYSIFGPSLVSYRLHYEKPRKTHATSKKKKTKTGP